MTQKEFLILLKELQSQPKETEWLEFKVSNSKPEEIGEYLSALTNSACYHRVKFGYLVFGVEDRTHRLGGTIFKPSQTKKGNQEIENWLATQLNPRVDFNIFESEHEGMHFAIFRIDATKSTPVHFKGKAFIRIGSIKKNLKDHPEKERKIWNRNDSFRFEKDTAKDRVSESGVLQLINYPKYFYLIQYPLPDNRAGIISKLLQDKIIVRRGELYAITNLGALLFSREIDAFERLSRKAIRVVIYDGKSRVKTKREKIGKKGYAVGFEGLVKYISDQLPSNEIIDNALRKEVSLYPVIAIRELVANAIIHQDFQIGGSSPMIEIFDNRMEITNPGKPLIDPLRFVDHSPESRNETLARFMRRVNICEERGSGIDKVVFECEYNQLPAPHFLVGDNFTKVILYGHKSLREMDKMDKTRACYLHACLKYVSGEQMSNQSLRERFGVKAQNYPIISRIISDCLQEGLIKDYDPDNKGPRYSKYVPFWV